MSKKLYKSEEKIREEVKECPKKLKYTQATSKWI